MPSSSNHLQQRRRSPVHRSVLRGACKPAAVWFCRGCQLQASCGQVPAWPTYTVAVAAEAPACRGQWRHASQVVVACQCSTHPSAQCGTAATAGHSTRHRGDASRWVQGGARGHATVHARHAPEARAIAAAAFHAAHQGHATALVGLLDPSEHGPWGTQAHPVCSVQHKGTYLFACVGRLPVQWGGGTSWDPPPPLPTQPHPPPPLHAPPLVHCRCLRRACIALSLHRCMGTRHAAAAAPCPAAAALPLLLHCTAAAAAAGHADATRCGAHW